MNPTIKLTPKDFFVQLGLTVALYTAVVSFINLAFDIVNKYMPDMLEYYNSSAYSIRWSISLLIVLVPLVYVLEWMVRKDIVKEPARRDVWIRRWRIYLTLFLTGASVIVDFIVLINTYLGGEISGRFIVKALIVLVVSGLLFVLFFFERSSDEHDKARRILRWVLGGCALVGVILGFVVAGSPTAERLTRIDLQRVSDLTDIQYRVINYWQLNGKLPATVAEASGGYATVPTDPVTKTAYEYIIKSPTPTFSLCATFDRATAPELTKPYTGQLANDVWTHTAGHACFDRTIDPKLYPPIPKK